MKKSLFWCIPLSFVTTVTLQILVAPEALAANLAKQVGNVRAELSYQKSETIAREIRLKILRNKKVVLDEVVASRGFTYFLDLNVQDLDGDKEPEVIFTHNPEGGQRCCMTSLVYGYEQSSKVYTPALGEWKGAGFPKIRDINGDGKYEFVYRDWRFAYAFTSFADSVMPIRIWQYRQGQINEVTSQYPQVIRQSIKSGNEWYQTLVRDKRDLKGTFAAYAAEKFLLGERQEALEEIRRSYPGADKQEFIDKLLQFLDKTGYTAIPEK